MWRRSSLLAFGAAFTALIALSARPGRAAGFNSLSRPAQACAPFAHDLSLPGLWLGHFTGGRLARISDGGRVLVWRDNYQCFPTRAACDRWQSRLLAHYRAVQGYRTCLPLRAGGVQIRRRIAKTHVVIAKY